MAITQEGGASPRGEQRILTKNENVSVAQTGNTTLLEVFTSAVEKLSVQVVNTVQALDAFIVQARAHPDAAYVTLFSTAAAFTSPSGRIVASSGTDITTLGVASAWFDLDVSGLYSVKFLASGGNATPSVTSIYAGGAGGSGGAVGVASAAGAAAAPVPAPVTYTSRSGTITLGGTAQTLMAANTSRKGFWFQNQSDEVMWLSSLGTAAQDQPSLRVPIGGLYEPPAGGVPSAAISLISATTGKKFAAREW